MTVEEAALNAMGRAGLLQMELVRFLRYRTMAVPSMEQTHAALTALDALTDAEEANAALRVSINTSLAMP
jgi:hypothetical protein